MVESSLFFNISESKLDSSKKLPNDLMVFIKLSKNSSPKLNSIFTSLFNLNFLIFSLIMFIFLIFSSILIQLFIIKLNLLLSFHSLSIDFPFSVDNFILFGNFSDCFIISSFPKISLI